MSMAAVLIGFPQVSQLQLPLLRGRREFRHPRGLPPLDATILDDEVAVLVPDGPERPGRLEFFGSDGQLRRSASCPKGLTPTSLTSVGSALVVGGYEVRTLREGFTVGNYFEVRPPILEDEPGTDVFEVGGETTRERFLYYPAWYAIDTDRALSSWRPLPVPEARGGRIGFVGESDGSAMAWIVPHPDPDVTEGYGSLLEQRVDQAGRGALRELPVRVSHGEFSKVGTLEPGRIAAVVSDLDGSRLVELSGGAWSSTPLPDLDGYAAGISSDEAGRVCLDMYDSAHDRLLRWRLEGKRTVDAGEISRVHHQVEPDLTLVFEME